jgi:DNA topoisomerase I
LVADGNPKDPLFDHLNTTYLNNHLKTYMPNLTAKVFRTYNASQTLQDELSKPLDGALSVDEKVLEYNRANREVAILCNHQRSLPPKHNEQMDKLRATRDEVQADIKKCRHRKRKIEKGLFVPPAKPSRKKDDDKKEKKGKPKKRDRFPTTVLRCDKMTERLGARLKKINTKLIEKDELKTIALG